VCQVVLFFFFFQAEDGIRDRNVTGVQTCALPISSVALSSGGATNDALPPLSIRVLYGPRSVQTLGWFAQFPLPAPTPHPACQGWYQDANKILILEYPDKVGRLQCDNQYWTINL